MSKYYLVSEEQLEKVHICACGRCRPVKDTLRDIEVDEGMAAIIQILDKDHKEDAE